MHPPAGIRSVMFLPDSQRVVSGSKDQTMRICNVIIGVEECSLTTDDYTVESTVCFLSDYSSLSRK
jgi:WD40 repeat protein